MVDRALGDSSKWWRMSLRAKGVAVLAVPIAALFGALFSVYGVEDDVRNADQSVVRFYEIRDGLGALRSSLQDSHAAIVGYSATGEQHFLSVYDTARKTIATALAEVSAQTGNDPQAIASLAEIQRATGKELGLLDQVRALPVRSSEAGALMAREQSTMADLQAHVSLLNDQEERSFTGARFERDVARRRLFRTVILCGTLGPLGALFIHLILAGRMVRRLQAVQENARRLAHGLPLEPLPAGTDEIASLGVQLETAAYLLRERERELSDSERRYRDIFDHAPIPYEETDLHGAVRRFNQAVCTLLKCTPQEMVGRLAWDFMSPERQDQARVSMKRRMQTGEEAAPFECEYMLDDGSRIMVEIRENLIRNDRGEVTGIIRSLLDVTERNLAAVAARKVEQYALELRNKNEQLARALEAARSATVAKSRFLASVSHELRTPLNGIIGFSELLYDNKLGPLSGEQTEIMGDILTSGRHLLQLINDILDLSKVEAGRMEFRPERTNIETLVFEVRDVIRPLAAKKNLQLATDVPGDLIANLDPGRFKQVLYNYLSNAVKFTPAGGSITVRVARERAAGFRLEVEDTGIGIAPDEISRLFQEFAQLPNSRKIDQGTGLGLALTRHIVEAQGGSVAVKSELSRGSIFSAVFPLDSMIAAATK
ncbi:MAG: multi-sensor signal transduction histidine kinase [Candidatus Solibacter sp.]|nr:multi-sensor signal transduction histidine kinase [Candidatus Solibacter sp.]